MKDCWAAGLTISGPKSMIGISEIEIVVFCVTGMEEDQYKGKYRRYWIGLLHEISKRRMDSWGLWYTIGSLFLVLQSSWYLHIFDLFKREALQCRFKVCEYFAM